MIWTPLYFEETIHYLARRDVQFLCHFNSERRKYNTIIDNIRCQIDKPVVCVENLYDNGKIYIANSERGVVDGAGYRFGSKWIHSNKIKVELAYVLTIYSTIGDQYDHVVLLSESGIMDKKVLYVAISRAKQSFLALSQAEPLRIR